MGANARVVMQSCGKTGRRRSILIIIHGLILLIWQSTNPVKTPSPHTGIKLVNIVLSIVIFVGPPFRLLGSKIDTWIVQHKKYKAHRLWAWGWMRAHNSFVPGCPDPTWELIVCPRFCYQHTRFGLSPSVANVLACSKGKSCLSTKYHYPHTHIHYYPHSDFRWPFQYRHGVLTV